MKRNPMHPINCFAPLSLALLIMPASLFAGSLQDAARHYKKDLTEKVFPYWHDTIVDKENGGYVLGNRSRQKMDFSLKIGSTLMLRSCRMGFVCRAAGLKSDLIRASSFLLFTPFFLE